MKVYQLLEHIEFVEISRIEQNNNFPDIFVMTFFDKICNYLSNEGSNKLSITKISAEQFI
jgi:hypothetical protein